MARSKDVVLQPSYMQGAVDFRQLFDKNAFLFAAIICSWYSDLMFSLR